MPISLEKLLLPFFIRNRRLQKWETPDEPASSRIKYGQLMKAPDHIKRDIGLLDGRARRGG